MYDFSAGLISALLSSVAFGTYFVPMKKEKSCDPFAYQFVMAIAVFCFSIFIALITNNLNFGFLPFIAGLLWATGNIVSVLAVNKSGLAKTAPIWMGLGILVSMSWGIFIFNEKITQVPLAIIGTTMLLGGIWFLSKISETKQLESNRGIIFAILSGILFGSYLVPVKNSGLSPIQYMFPMSLGIMSEALMIYFFKKPILVKDHIKPALLSGTIWSVGNLLLVFAITKIGLFLAFPLSQIALLVSVSWGILYFKEIKRRSNITKIISLSIILFAGAMLLSISG